MIAVSNTTPLRYLIAIDLDVLLARFFDVVRIPLAVKEELTNPNSPDKVRQFIRVPPSWLEVCIVEQSTTLLSPRFLHNGEREAILLAEQTRPDVLLLDEQIARATARARKIALSGTLGLIERGDQFGYIEDFAGTLAQLKESGFFLSESLRKRLLTRHLQRHELRKRDR